MSAEPKANSESAPLEVQVATYAISKELDMLVMQYGRLLVRLAAQAWLSAQNESATATATSGETENG